jgi:hypothetical protein
MLGIGTGNGLPLPVHNNKKPFNSFYSMQLTPLRQESEHWAEQLGCSQPQQSINPSPQNGSTTISTNNNNNSNHDDNKEIKEEEQEKEEESQEMRQTAQQQQQNNTKSNGPWDTLHSLANAKKYCSSGNGGEEEEEEENPAEPIWSKARMDQWTFMYILILSDM